MYALLVTLAVAIPSAVILFFFSPLAVRILYRALASEEKLVLVRLVKIFCISAVFSSGAQTLSACLTAQGEPKHSLLSASVSSLVRLVLDIALVSSAKISVYGAAISANVGYFVAFFMDLLYNISITKRRKNANDNGSGFGCRRGRFNGKRKTSDSFGG